jgi:hypothetical protein
MTIPNVSMVGLQTDARNLVSSIDTLNCLLLSISEVAAVGINTTADPVEAQALREILGLVDQFAGHCKIKAIAGNSDRSIHQSATLFSRT